ncbi:hypothetical protein LTR66_008260 [Elasticomyces elasticus]|nr:hypothetical protein LTR66_008260 [Elasticomyces elasticus]
MANAKYTYAALPTPTSIRLLTDLKLVACSDAAKDEAVNGDELVPQIQCSMQTFDLKDSPHYDCLSYTWGNPFRVYQSEIESQQVASRFARSLSILCDDQILFIGRNLHDFLLSIIQSQRRPHVLRQQCGVDKAAFTWVDAVCINQGDIEERARQVVVMDQIYSGASTVIAWLGEKDVFSYHALAALVTMANFKEEVVETAKLVNPMHTNMTRFGLSDDGPSFAIYAFFKRAWFRRAWVVQEAVLAKRLVFVCGTITGAFTLLTSAARFLYRSSWWSMISDAAKNHQKTGLTHGFLLQFITPSIARTMAAMDRVLYERDLDSYFDPVYSVLEILDARGHFQRDDDLFVRLRPDVECRPPTYVDILTRFRVLESEDPRDKVYAFLGLRPTPTIPERLKPDYSNHNTPEQVYFAATLHILHTEKDLKILSQVEDRSERIFTSLPSWVPDFSAVTSGISIGDSVFSPWSAAGDERLQLNDERFSDRLLELRGIFVDKIAETGRYEDGNFTAILPMVMGLRRYYSTDELPEGHHIIRWPEQSTQDQDIPGRSAMVMPEEGLDQNFDGPNPASSHREITRRHSEPGLHQPLEEMASLSLRLPTLGQTPETAVSVETPWLPGRPSHIMTGPTEDEGDWLTESDGTDDQSESLVESDKDGPEAMRSSNRSVWMPARRGGQVVSTNRVQTRIEVLWRTLIADCCVDKHPAPLAYGFAFAYGVQWAMHQASLVAMRQMVSRQNNADDDDDDHLLNFNRRLNALKALAEGEPGDYAELEELERAQSEANEKQRQDGGDNWKVDIRLGPTRFLPEVKKIEAEFLSDSRADNPDASELWNRQAQVSRQRTLFRTSLHLYLGNGPKSVAAGDEVWILAGGNVPYILRQKDNGNYELIGECYVHGIMHGEVLPGQDDDAFRRVTLE